MLPNRIAQIPASAQCLTGGPWVWSMVHPDAERMEVRFAAASNWPMLSWWLMHAGLGGAVGLYGWLSYGLLWPDFLWEHAKYFLIVSVLFWAWLFAVHPGGRLLVHAMTIDRVTRTITGTGVVFGKRVVFTVPMADVTTVMYWPGSNINSRSSQLEIIFTRPHRCMRSPPLASVDEEICDWISAMLGKTLVAK